MRTELSEVPRERISVKSNCRATAKDPVGLMTMTFFHFPCNIMSGLERRPAQRGRPAGSVPETYKL